MTGRTQRSVQLNKLTHSIIQAAAVAASRIEQARAATAEAAPASLLVVVVAVVVGPVALAAVVDMTSRRVIQEGTKYKAQQYGDIMQFTMA